MIEFSIFHAAWRAEWNTGVENRENYTLERQAVFLQGVDANVWVPEHLVLRVKFITAFATGMCDLIRLMDVI